MYSEYILHSDMKSLILFPCPIITISYKAVNKKKVNKTKTQHRPNEYAEAAGSYLSPSHFQKLSWVEYPHLLHVLQIPSLAQLYT